MICLMFDDKIFLPKTYFLSIINETILAIKKAMIQLGVTPIPINTFKICLIENRIKSETVAIRV